MLKNPQNNNPLDEIWVYNHLSDKGKRSLRIDTEFFPTHTPYIRADKSVPISELEALIEKYDGSKAGTFKTTEPFGNNILIDLQNLIDKEGE